jgi:hypothetical protein
MIEVMAVSNNRDSLREGQVLWSGIHNCIFDLHIESAMEWID